MAELENNQAAAAKEKAAGEETEGAVPTGLVQIISDDQDRELSLVDGHERKQMFFRGIELKVHEGGEKFPGGTVEGLANAFGNVDFQNERVKPGAFRRTIKAFKATTGIPFMDNHRIFSGTDAVIGRVIELKEEKAGLFFKAMFSTVTEAQAVRTKVREGVLNSLSIGFNVIKDKVMPDGVRELLEIRLREISIVTFPANELATVSDVKRAIGRIEICEDMGREYDEVMAAKRWQDWCGKGQSMVMWGDEQWAKYMGGFAIADLNAVTREKAFRLPVIDIIGGEPRIILGAVKAAIAELGEGDKFLGTLLNKFPKQKSKPAEPASVSAPVREDKQVPVLASTMRPAIDALSAEVRRMKRARMLAELKTQVDRGRTLYGGE